MAVNVLHFINNLDREGAQVMVANLVSAGDKAAINYAVCVRQPGGPLVAELRQKGLQVFQPGAYLGFRSTGQSVAYLAQICRENQIRLIHAHMADAAFLGWLAARKLNIPLVISHHGHDILLQCNPVCRGVYFILLNLAARFARANIAVSTSVAERVHKLLRLRHERVQVIDNGVPLPTAAELVTRRTAHEKHPDSLILVNVGRLVPLKGQRQLIRAVSRLVKDIPEIRLYLVGGGGMMPELQQLAESKQVGRHVEFTGTVNDVSEYLTRADIYVSSSESEGMPVAVLEAMAWEIPVVASNIPGNRGVVKADETGFLYELDNLDDLVEKLIAARANATSATTMAKRARIMVERQYSARAAEQKHALLYRQILGLACTGPVTGISG